MLRSLGFFIKKKRSMDKSLVKADFLMVADYHDFLRDAEPAVMASAEAFDEAVEMGHPLPLGEIELSQIQYGDIVTQMFDGGVSYTAVSLATNVPPEPPPAAVADYFANYVAGLGGGAEQTRGDVESIMERVDDLLAKPENVAHRVNGLVVGRVQSGKTRNYVGLMLKAASKGWNVMIVLTSANTQLADQTESRIKDDFRKSGAITAIRLELRSGDVPDPPSQISANTGSFYWGVAMKEATNLQRILKWLHDNGDLVPKMNLLVVDDEADNATPDSSVGKKKEARRLAEGEIEELVEAAADSGDFKPASEWMVDVQETLQRIQDDREAGRTTEETKAVDGLTSLLSITATSVDDVVSKYRVVLKLDSPDIEQNVKNFFIGPDATEMHKDDCFIRFLNTVLQIAQARSATNRRICELVGLAPVSGESVHPYARCAYVAYTATPYACILNERPGQTPLYADFIKSLAVSPRYFGLDRIFGTDRPPDAPAMNIVRSIPENEKRFALNPLEGIKDEQRKPKAVLKASIDADLRVTCKSPAYTGFWDSMREAVAWAFCAAAARRHRRNSSAQGAGSASLQKLEHRWTTMLVNISQLRRTHASLKEKIADYIGRRCATSGSAEEFVAECGRVWETFRAEFPKKKFDALFNSAPPGDASNYGGIADYPSWGELEADVRFFAERWRDSQNVHVIVINAGGKDAKEAQDRYNQVEKYKGTCLDDHLWIVCGGNTISRGLTLHGLVASYFDRVRKTAAVDTLTQMGRWFGYREGYELLPRIWMLSDTVGEMKKTAIVEGHMHESIARNFDEGFSPSDPDHYQEVYSWGRRLSGRDAAQRRLTRVLGTVATTNDLPGTPDAVREIATATEVFMRQMGTQMARPESDYRLYREYPLWDNIPRHFIIAQLKRVKALYPDSSRQMLETLIRKLEKAEQDGDMASCIWYFAMGFPSVGSGQLYSFKLFGGESITVRAGNPSTARLKNGVVRHANVRNYLTFYSMVPTRHLVLADADFLRDTVRDVARYLETRRDAATGALPPAVEAALREFPQPDLERRLVALADRLEEDGGRHEMPPAIHDCLPEGLRNRSAAIYRERVYERFRAETGEPTKPVFQIYLVTPPQGLETGGKPLVSCSFYWPDLPPDDCHLVAVDG